MDDNFDAKLFVATLKRKSQGLETKLQQSIQKYLRSIGAYCFKVHGNTYMKRGIPDIICCHKGLFYGIECKVGYNKMSDVQEAHRDMIIKAGGTHICAYNLDDVKNIIK